MSLFDKKAAKNLLLKQVEKQKAKHNTQSSTPASAAYPSHHAPHPASSHVPHPKPPPGYPSSSSSHSAHTKNNNWQGKVSQKLNDPKVKAKVENAAKKKATKSIIKGVGGLLFTAFEE